MILVRRLVGFALVAMCAAAALAMSAGCSAGGAPSAENRDRRADALIESGNVAYRQGDYRLALRRFAAAAVVRKDDPAAFYGMGMALSKLGRDEEARTAYARARELTQQTGPSTRGAVRTP